MRPTRNPGEVGLSLPAVEHRAHLASDSELIGCCLFGPVGQAGVEPFQRRLAPASLGGCVQTGVVLTIVSPFPGSSFVRFPLLPRALPWAGMWLPLRGGKQRNTKKPRRRCTGSRP